MVEIAYIRIRDGRGEMNENGTAIVAKGRTTSVSAPRASPGGNAAYVAWASNIVVHLKSCHTSFFYSFLSLLPYAAATIVSTAHSSLPAPPGQWRAMI